MKLQMEIENEFFGRLRSVDELESACESVVSGGGRIYGAVFAVDMDIEDLLARLKAGRALKRGFKVGSRKPFLIELPRLADAVLPGEPEFARAFLCQGPRPGCATFVTCQGHDTLHYLASACHLYLRPHLCRTFLRTKEVHDSLNGLAKRWPDLAIRVRECVSRSLIDDPRSVKRVSTNRKWTDEDFALVFGKLAEERRWLSSVKLEVRGRAVGVGRIWRDACFSCEDGMGFFRETILPTIGEAVARSSGFFQNRGKAHSPTGQPRPVRIVYTENVFADKRQNQRLVKVLDGLPEASLSVFHPNPYLHACLLDYTDGSSYDIWVAKPSAILVVPKRKATTQSIERVCNQICDEFEEGDVVEFI